MPRATLADDDRARLAALVSALADGQARVTKLAQQRDDLLRELARTGVTYEALANSAGLTEGRVGQICGRKRPRSVEQD